jgi:hypothetical protein
LSSVVCNICMGVIEPGVDLHHCSTDYQRPCGLDSEIPVPLYIQGPPFLNFYKLDRNCGEPTTI